MEYSPLRQLRMGRLPRMVSWYDPRLLARVGVRTIVSSVFGQYADQRLMQAVTDPCNDTELCQRYDYSNIDAPADAEKRRIASRSTTPGPSGSTTWLTWATVSSPLIRPPISSPRTVSMCAARASCGTAKS